MADRENKKIGKTARGFFELASPKDDEDFWCDKLLGDFSINASLLGGLKANAKELHEKLSRLQDASIGTLISAHTKVFLHRDKINNVLLNLMVDNADNLHKLIKVGRYSRDSLKELQLLAAFWGSKEVLSQLTKEHGLEIDGDVLNMALLSGKFVGEQLKTMTKMIQPTYNSIRYAIKSGNEYVVEELFNNHGLVPKSEHLVAAASTGNAKLFDLIIKRGVVPSGTFVYRAAVASDNMKILEQLKGFGYPSGGKSASSAAVKPIEESGKESAAVKPIEESGAESASAAGPRI